MRLPSDRGLLDFALSSVRWLVRCEEHLDQDFRYVQSIADGRLCYATALPLFIGLRTAALLRDSTWDSLAAGIEVSRLETAKILAATALACRDSARMKKLHHKLAGKTVN